MVADTMPATITLNTYTKISTKFTCMYFFIVHHMILPVLSCLEDKKDIFILVKAPNIYIIPFVGHFPSIKTLDAFGNEGIMSRT